MKHLPCTTEKKSFYVKIHLGIMKEKKKTIKRFKKKKNVVNSEESEAPKIKQKRERGKKKQN